MQIGSWKKHDKHIVSRETKKAGQYQTTEKWINEQRERETETETENIERERDQ
jgi:hypothetical protein